jgi:molecular chaperone GrpE
MLQRTLFRAARQAARPVQRIQPAFAPITRAAPAIRWYSDAAPAEAKKEGEAADQSTDASAQLKEQLEKKDKEVIDLKVRCALPRLHHHSSPHTNTTAG